MSSNLAGFSVGPLTDYIEIVASENLAARSQKLARCGPEHLSGGDASRWKLLTNLGRSVTLGEGLAAELRSFSILHRAFIYPSTWCDALMSGSR